MIVFLVRHYNDIDHIVPIAYRMLKDGAPEVKVFCMDASLPVAGDFRLNFLKEQFGSPTNYIYQAHTPSFGHRLFSFAHSQALNGEAPLPSRWAAKIVRRIFGRVHGSSWRDQLYGKAWAREFLQKYDVQCLVIDYGRKGRFIYKAISDAADELGIRKVGVPHGFDLATNLLWTNRHVADQRPPDLLKEWGWLGELAVSSHASKEKYIECGLSAEDLKVLGSARFCDEWLDVYHDLLPPQPFPNSNGKLKVVYMDHGTGYRVNTEQVLASFQAIAELGFVDTVIKASTRVSLSDERLAEYSRIDSETHSAHLIRWADVVMTAKSSIALEVFHLNKVFVYPAYFHENRMLWEDYGACWNVSNVDELSGALRTIHDGAARLPYSPEEVRAFQTEVVYGGNPEGDVLGNYVDFIVNG